MFPLAVDQRSTLTALKRNTMTSRAMSPVYFVHFHLVAERKATGKKTNPNDCAHEGELAPINHKWQSANARRF